MTDAERMIAEARKALFVMVGVLAVIWAVQIVNWADSYRLSVDYGIKARDVGSLPDILTAPFMHYSWDHIEGNSGPLFIFGFLAAYRGVRKFVGLSLLVVAVSGLGAWFTSADNSVTAGASGVVFGYFGYILVRGAFDRHKIDIVIGLVMALCFAYQFTVLLPHNGISWQGHLFGFAGGILGGWIFRDRSAATADTLGRAPEKSVTGGTGPGGSGKGGDAPAPGSAAALLKELDDLGL
jgi:membrane associated rhomboid family serine protease